jgi:hypothetical protein
VAPQGGGSRAALVRIATISGVLREFVAPLILEITENKLLGVFEKNPEDKRKFSSEKIATYQITRRHTVCDRQLNTYRNEDLNLKKK